MSSKLDQLQLANRILSLLLIFIVSSTLLVSPIISSPLFGSQKDSRAAFAEIDIQRDPVPETENQEDPLSAFFPLVPNVAYGQGAESSDSFSLTVTDPTCEDVEEGGDPIIIPVGNGELILDTSDGNEIHGDNGDDVIHGCDGDDFLFGENGLDELFGDNGDDFLFGGNAKDELTGGPGSDTFDCGNADDTIMDFNEGEDNYVLDDNENEFPPNTTTDQELSTCENANTPPTLQLPPTQIAEATSTSGASVTFDPAPTASDEQDPSITPVCTPPSGSTFPLGTTTVACTATDTDGATTTGSFDVIVQDTLAPVLTVPDIFSATFESPV